jgi:hypothetical protein
VSRRAVENIAAPEKPDHRHTPQPFKFQPSSNATGIRGVFKHGKHGYRALIGERGKLVHLGTFRTIEEAAAAFALADKKRQVEKIARTGTAEEVAQRIEELIKLTISFSRDRFDGEALCRLHKAAEIVSAIGKGSGHVVADAVTDAEELLRLSPTLGPHRTLVAAR